MQRNPEKLFCFTGTHFYAVVNRVRGNVYSPFPLFGKKFEAVRFEFAGQAVWEIGGAEKVDDSAEKPHKYQYFGKYEADYFYGKGYGPPDRRTADYVAVEDVFFSSASYM